MIHSTVIIRGDVTIADDVSIDAYSIITGPCRIGRGTRISSHCVIGAEPQMREDATEPVHELVIGEMCVIREHAALHHGVITPTIIGDRVMLMLGTHVAHDSRIGNDSTIGSWAALGGFTYIGNGVTFGQGVVTHPWTVIAGGAMVGLNSSIIRDVRPYQKVAGSPARLLGANTHKAKHLSPEWVETELSADDLWDEAVLRGKRAIVRDEWQNRG